jgi:hypothetical protein
MKTATITIYHIFGTKAGKSADITYRGKLLYSFSGIESDQELCDKARKWAKAQNFTHTRILLN